MVIKWLEVLSNLWYPFISTNPIHLDYQHSPEPCFALKCTAPKYPIRKCIRVRLECCYKKKVSIHFNKDRSIPNDYYIFIIIQFWKHIFLDHFETINRRNQASTYSLSLSKSSTLRTFFQPFCCSRKSLTAAKASGGGGFTSWPWPPNVKRGEARVLVGKRDGWKSS
jgi:hypothetical protein